MKRKKGKGVEEKDPMCGSKAENTTGTTCRLINRAKKEEKKGDGVPRQR